MSNPKKNSIRRSAEELFQPLANYADRIPLANLEDWLDSAQPQLGDVEPFLRFHGDHYLRNLMWSGPAVQALVLCWRNGQRSPIHDHIGSSCAVKVLRGSATETIFETAPNGMIFASRSHLLGEGATCGSQDRDIHQVSNLQADDAELVTLHLYSPPLLSMNMYSLVDATVKRFFDPINDEFVHGGGI